MGTKMRGNENKGESYRVRTGSELTGVVSERVLTLSLFPDHMISHDYLLVFVWSPAFPYLSFQVYLVPLQFLCLHELASFEGSSTCIFLTFKTHSRYFEACVGL